MGSVTPTAFVLMPFEAAFTPIFTDLIRPALEEAGYDVKRADSVIDQRNILAMIVQQITSAELIVADLTTQNPNVFYELGLAHALRKPTIMIAQTIEDVPFDLRPYRVILYSTQFNEVHRLKGDLKEIADKHRNAAVIFDNPVTDFSPREIAPSVALNPAESAEQAQEVPKGFLDFLVEVQDASERIAQISGELTIATTDYTERLNISTEELAKAKESGANLHRRAYQIALKAASAMDTYTDQLRRLAPQLEEANESMANSSAGFIDWFQPQTAEDLKQLVSVRTTFEQLIATAARSRSSIEQQGETTKSLQAQGVSRELIRSCARLVAALELTAAVVSRIEAGGARILNVIDAKTDVGPQTTS